jgi:hypothetical protein
VLFKYKEIKEKAINIKKVINIKEAIKVKGNKF